MQRRADSRTRKTASKRPLIRRPPWARKNPFRKCNSGFNYFSPASPIAKILRRLCLLRNDGRKSAPRCSRRRPVPRGQSQDARGACLSWKNIFFHLQIAQKMAKSRQNQWVMTFGMVLVAISSRWTLFPFLLRLFIGSFLRTFVSRRQKSSMEISSHDLARIPGFTPHIIPCPIGGLQKYWFSGYIMSDETSRRSGDESDAKNGAGGGVGEPASLQGRAPFLANWDWQSVVRINERLCR